jgi:O-antigen ligase
LLITAGVVLTWRECKWLIYTLAASAVVNLAIARVFLTYDGDGRINLSDVNFSQSSLANSNDLAGHLILILPFLLFFVLSPKGNALLRIAALGLIAFGLYLVLGSGSRGAAIAVACASLFLLLRASTGQRFAALVLLPVLAVGALSLMPRSAMERLVKYSGDSSAGMDEAALSQQIRTYVLRKSLLYTATNPLFGIGPGQFGSYEGKESNQEGHRGAWIQTHNVYTQISSECGIPGLLLYVCGIAAAFRLLNKTYKRAGKDPRNRDIAVAAFCVMLSLVGFCTVITFLTIGYRFYLPALCGLAITLACAAEKEMAARSSRSSVPFRPA